MTAHLSIQHKIKLKIKKTFKAASQQVGLTKVSTVKQIKQEKLLSRTEIIQPEVQNLNLTLGALHRKKDLKEIRRVSNIRLIKPLSNKE